MYIYIYVYIYIEPPKYVPIVRVFAWVSESGARVGENLGFGGDVGTLGLY